MHLLLARTATLDEAEPAAVDLGQTAGDIVFLSFTDSDLNAMAAAWRMAARVEGEAVLPSLRLASLARLRHPLSVDLYVERVIERSRYVLVRLLGGLDYWRYGLESVAAACRARGAVLAAVPGCDKPDPRLAALSMEAPTDLERIDGWLRAGGPGNLQSLLGWVRFRLGHERAIWCPPQPLPAAAALDRNGRTMCPSEALATCPADRPLALVLCYRSMVLAADVAPIMALRDGLEAHGLSCLTIFVRSLKDPDSTRIVAEAIAERRPDVVVTATAFAAGDGQGGGVLAGADAPVLQVILSTHDAEAWERSPRGLSGTDLAMQVVLPESDGRIVVRAISAKGPGGDVGQGSTVVPGQGIDHDAILHRPLLDRIAVTAALAAAWVRLARTPRHERRLAMVLSDYPGRGGRQAYAVGLDTPASVASILALLHGHGYRTVPCASDSIIPALTAPSDWLTLSLDDYLAWRQRWPAEAREAQTRAWGEPDADPDLDGRAWRFPVLRSGSLSVLLQPDRGRGVDRRASYHDPALPPRHAYAAFHLALRHQDPHALIQLGTHGTLEWLPGKAVALSRACWPELLLGPMPVIYPFIVNNPGEAAPAKRRIGAVTLGHLTPPPIAAELHGEAAVLESLIEEYGAADGVDPRRCRLLRVEIRRAAEEAGLTAECGVRADMDDADAVARIDAWLCDLKDMSVRDGLHVFAKTPQPEAQARLASAIGGDDAVGLVRASAAREAVGLLAALDGRWVAPGPAGAPTRGRRDVLPTGRNLVTIDPRTIPTALAWRLGRRAAEAVLDRHLQDRGDWLRSVVIDLWASPTLRTGGEDLAQALALLGVAPRWDEAGARVVGVEVWPASVLDRPRVDVSVRISGLFRDLFPEQIRLFALAVRTVAALDEPDAINPLAADRRSGHRIDRIFGGAPGTYGAGVAGVALDHANPDRAATARAYLDAGGWAFGLDADAEPMAAAFSQRVAAADALIHGQDDGERDLLDGDGVADFMGGFAAAAAMLGSSPALYHVDMSRPDTGPTVRTLAESVARTVRGRLCNPRWITGMMRHGHRGAADFAQSADALFAFALTAGNDVVSHAQIEAVFTAWVGDTAVAAFLRETNPDAARAIAERFRQLLDRGLWRPRRNDAGPLLQALAGEDHAGTVAA